MNAHTHLVNYLIERDHVLSVYCYGECFIEDSVDADAVIKALESVEEVQLNAYHKDDTETCVAMAYIIPYGVGPDETVADYSDNALMNEWFRVYEQEDYYA